MADKIPMVITPRGIAQYAWLSKPDTKFNSEGDYKVTLVLDKKDMAEGRLNGGKKEVPGKDWVKAVLAMAKDAGVTTDMKAAGCPIHDGDGYLNGRGNRVEKEEFAGKLVIAFKSKYKPKLIDVKGNELPDSIPVYAGDVIKVACRPKAVRMPDGTQLLKLYPNTVMLVEKRAESRNVANMFGEEEGFEVSEKDAAGADDLDFGEVPDDDVDF
jgi:hypothetical protein